MGEDDDKQQDFFRESTINCFFFFYNCCPSLQIKLHELHKMEEALPKECLPNLISLRTLYLDKCPLPQGIRYLTALQNLSVLKSEVVDLSNDLSNEWQGLGTLLSLQFYELPKLVSLPTGLQYVSSLQKLDIWDCPSLIAIPEWICKLISLLQSLLIWDCPNLESLPEGIGALTSLQTLNISRCPILLKRCKKQIGEDWHKISHIPNLEGQLFWQEEEPDEEEPNEEISDEEEANEEAKKPACQNWDLIKAFGCCNCSTTQQLTH